jgi:CHAD domain-containing protein
MGDKLGLRTDTPVGDALVAFAHDILREARSAIDTAENSDAVAVHDFRKAMKRWRAHLRLLEPLVGLDARGLRDEARDLARSLAAARDQQAALDALADVQRGENFISARSWNSIRERLEGLRQNAETVALTEETRAGLRAAIDAAARAVDGWSLAQVEFWQVAESLQEGYARACAAIPTHWKEAEDEALHTLRQRVVVHRYQMDLVEPLWPRLGKLWIAEAQRLRERLGAHQDLAILEKLTGPHQALAPWRSRLTVLIQTRKAVHVQASRRLAGRLFAERPKAFRRRLQGLWESASGVAN